MVHAFRIAVLLILLVGVSGLGFSLEETGKPAAAGAQLESRYRESVRPILEKYLSLIHI